MAAASIPQDLSGAAGCRERLPRLRHQLGPPDGRPGGFVNDLVNANELVEKGGKPVERDSAFCPSLFACAGFSWTSRNTASTPAATRRDAMGRMNFRLAAGGGPLPPGNCRLCVDVVDHRVSQRPEDRGKRAHVDDQVVVPKAIAALGDEE